MVDKYTKVILTIIAANLTLMTLQGLNIIPQANADGGVQKVQICDNTGFTCAFVQPTQGGGNYGNLFVDVR